MRSALTGLDRSTRWFWRVTGRPVDLAGEHAWLSAPTSTGPTVGGTWVEAAARAHGGTVVDPGGDGGPAGGLLADMALLDGPSFRARDLRPEVRDFYEQTSRWRMEVRARWTPVFRPGGAAVTRIFARRVQQLALPAPRGGATLALDSSVRVIVGPDGQQRAAAWLRTMPSSGDHVFSGCYSTRLLPDDAQPSVHVAFPLESGNVQVFLRPRVLAGGTLLLSSPTGRFGQPGAYVVVHDRGHHGARVPIHETFVVHVDDEGVLRADHTLALWGATAVRLSYRLTRADG
jgi:hypothetical protein